MQDHKFTRFTTPSPAEWDAFVAETPAGNLLQTSRWGDLKAHFGWEAERIAISADDCIIAGAQVLYRSFPLGLTMAYVPRGPLVDWENEKTAHSLLVAISERARLHGAFCLKLEPDLAYRPELSQVVKRYGPVLSHQSIQPRASILVALDRDEADILAGMKSKTRYNIRLAARKGVEVCEGTLEDLPEFYRMMVATGERDRFAIFSPEYYRMLFELFSPGGFIKLLLATYQGTILAGIFVVRWGQKAWYIYGASANEHRNLMPAYLLQWEGMRWARSQGCKTYDLWGIPDEIREDPERYARSPDTPTEDIWGVYVFKQGFGGKVATYLGAYDIPIQRPVYWMYNTAITLPERVWGVTWHRRLRAG